MKTMTVVFQLRVPKGVRVEDLKEAVRDGLRQIPEENGVTLHRNRVEVFNG